MSDTTVRHALSGAAAALTRGPEDVTDALATLVADCAAGLGAAAVAVMTRDGDDSRVALLSATSHRAAEIEMLQIQHDRGPCVECLRTDRMVRASGEEMVRRWGEVGHGIAAAGFESVVAFPMRYRATTIGGLNIFHAEGRLAAEDEDMVQAVADMATLLVVHARPVPRHHVDGLVHDALRAREVVEQAKGVLAYLEQVDMATAYERLLERSRCDGTSLTRTALDVVAQAQQG
jgi:hypothetical protein